MRFATLALLVLLQSFDSPALAQDRDPASNELRVAWGTPRSLDPAHAGAGIVTTRLALSLFTGLTTFGPDGTSVIAGAAERWETSQDGLTWTFHLRDVKWSDGAPVTAGDFVYAWRRVLRPETGSATVFAFAPVRGALAFWEDRRLDQELLTFDSQPASERLAIANRWKDRATQRHANAIRGLAEAERETAVRAALDEAAKAATRPDLDERAIGAEAVDARTLRVTLAATSPTLLEELAGPAFLPVPAQIVERKLDQWTHPQNIATNGAYRVEKWTRDELTLLRAGPAGPERVTLVLGAHIAGALEAFARGQVQWIDRDLVPPESVPELVRKGDVRPFATFTMWHLSLNAAKGPCASSKIRAAIALAIDRSRVLKQAGTGCEAAVGLVPPGCPGYVGASAPVQDITAAIRHLLAEQPDLTKFPRLNFLGPKSHQSVVIAMKEQLEKDLGIAIRLDLREWPAYREALDAADYDLAYGVWSGPTFDPAAFLAPFATGDAGKLLAEAGRESNAAARLNLLARAEASLLAEGGAIVPLHTGGDFIVAKSNVKLSLNPMGRILLQNVRLEK